MIDRLLSSTDNLEKSLDGTWMRNQAISHNISNADTPGYKKKQVEFEEELVKAIAGRGFPGKKTRQGHIQVGDPSLDDVKPRIIETKSSKMRIDENNVDIETEMAALATNTIMHHALVQKLNGELHRLKSIINEGRR